MADILSLVAHLRAKPGMEQELVRTMTALVGPSRKEEGCIDYHLHQSNDDPAAIVVYENWREMADELCPKVGDGAIRRRVWFA